jgi:hypothetical protein
MSLAAGSVCVILSAGGTTDDKLRLKHCSPAAAGGTVLKSLFSQQYVDELHRAS